jgi:predicted naringenin-chalcone synthase
MAFLHHIETLVPENSYPQGMIRDRLADWSANPKTARVIRLLSDRSGISRRHLLLRDVEPTAEPVLFRTGSDGRLIEPSTGQRNRVYIDGARRMSVEVARRALANAPQFSPSDITHVVTVSCTGFYNPGPDFDIVLGLGLAPSTERYHIGFMGCYAAFPALRMADQFCRANPNAVVLVVCLEFCSLHMQVSDNPDTILANTLFSDGAAAAIVSARQPSAIAPALDIGPFLPALAVEGRQDMAWEIGDRGFNMVLSSYVPEIIAANLDGIVDDALARAVMEREEIDLWAIHPGGKAILDKVEDGLGLAPHQLQAARDVLRDYGNMSSATILFVLRQLLEEAAVDRTGKPRTICAMAFGPGLTIETAVMETVPATVPMATHELCTR